MKIEDKFGKCYGEPRNEYWRNVRVVGLEFIFQILCLIVEIMIYRLPKRDSIDGKRIKDFENKLKEIKK